MAQGDRVRVGDGSTWDNSVVVSVYSPRWEPNGDLALDHFGAAQIMRLGGVKGGTTGVIAGPSIRVHRTQLIGEANTPNMGGLDLVHLFPVQLDHYMQVGWLPTHHIRVIGGEPLRS